MSKKQFSIRLDMDLYEQLDNYRWDNRTTLNEIISEALEKHLKAMGSQSQPPSNKKNS